jgi:hypothetical protein
VRQRILKTSHLVITPGSTEYGVSRQAFLFKIQPQTFQRLDLDLSHALACQSDFSTDLFECAHLIASQTEPAAHDLALLLG